MQQLSIDVQPVPKRVMEGRKKRTITLFKEGMQLCHSSPVFSAQEMRIIWDQFPTPAKASRS
jgi:hypothetical protein